MGRSPRLWGGLRQVVGRSPPCCGAVSAMLWGGLPTAPPAAGGNLDKSGPVGDRTTTSVNVVRSGDRTTTSVNAVRSGDRTTTAAPWLWGGLPTSHRRLATRPQGGPVGRPDHNSRAASATLPSMGETALGGRWRRPAWNWSANSGSGRCTSGRIRGSGRSPCPRGTRSRSRHAPATAGC